MQFTGAPANSPALFWETCPTQTCGWWRQAHVQQAVKTIKGEVKWDSGWISFCSFSFRFLLMFMTARCHTVTACWDTNKAGSSWRLLAVSPLFQSQNVHRETGLLFFILFTAIPQSLLTLCQCSNCLFLCWEMRSLLTLVDESLSHWPWWGVHMTYQQCLLSLIRQWPNAVSLLPALQYGLCYVTLFNNHGNVICCKRECPI